MTVLVRFAPSPTGFLHVGNLRAALINWLFARKLGGQFMLRFDDTDSERSTVEYEEAIREDLRWLGLNWDREFRQRERFERYADAQQKLLESGRLYACYETAEELDVKRKMLASRGLPPIYDRAALTLTRDQIAQYEADGRKPHYRFKLEDKEICWEDGIRGPQSLRPTHISDPVLVRADGVPLYTLSSTVDDGDTGITHVLRGEDHVTNTAVQIQIFEALGYQTPIFAHNALLQMQDAKLSKRTGGGAVRDFRAEGYEAMAINSLLARLGTSEPVEPFMNLEEVMAGFDLNHFGRAAANFDPAELLRLNHAILSTSHFKAVKQRLAEDGLGEADETFFNSVKPNLNLLPEIKQWWEILRQPITPQIAAEDQEFCQLAAKLRPNAESFKAWVDQLKQQSERKGKTLFMPLRYALTARNDGPELAKVFDLLPQQVAIGRLSGNKC